MRRIIPNMALGIFCTCLFVSFISVYLFHDLDPGQTERTAYLGLCVEGAVFDLIVVGPTFLLTAVGLRLLSLRSHPSQAKLGLLLGVGVTAVQYPWELAGRLLARKYTDIFLWAYLLGAIMFCTTFLLWDSRKQSLRQPF